MYQKFDSWEKYQEVLAKIKSEYESIEKSAHCVFDAKKDVEMQYAPFKNRFKLAVLGRVSAGKSTFINSIIGEPGLLPTDSSQKTGMLTHIVFGSKKRVKIAFFDGSSIVSETDIAKTIEEYVSIPDEFKDLPLWEINQAILDGNTTDEIVKHFSSNKFDVPLLKQYLDKTDLGRIPVKIIVEVPSLPFSMRGWDIIDTPGIGGNYDACTYGLLNSVDESLDAVVFLHKGDDTMDDSKSTEVLKESFSKIADNTKKRLFFILTFRSKTTELQRKKEHERVLRIVNEYGISQDRIFFVDSLAHLLLQYGRNFCGGCDILRKHYLESTKPNGWSENDWDASVPIIEKAMAMASKINGGIMDEKGEYSSEMATAFEDMASFETLLNGLNSFAVKDRDASFRSIVGDIKSDYSSSLYNKTSDLGVLKGLLESNLQQRSNVKEESTIPKEERRRQNDAFRIIENEYKRSTIEKELKKAAKTGEKEHLDSTLYEKKLSDVYFASTSIKDRAFTELKNHVNSIVNKEKGNASHRSYSEIKNRVEKELQGDKKPIAAWFYRLFHSSTIQAKISIRLWQEVDSYIIKRTNVCVESIAEWKAAFITKIQNLEKEQQEREKLLRDLSQSIEDSKRKIQALEMDIDLLNGSFNTICAYEKEI